MAGSSHRQTVLVIAPIGGDAAVIGEVLDEIEVVVEARTHLSRIKEALLQYDAVLLTEEALELPHFTELMLALKSQPAWSEIPVIFLAGGGGLRPEDKVQLAGLGVGNLTVLERPMASATLQRTVQVALRSRRRQYQVRDLLESERTARTEAERATQLKDEFLAVVSHELRTPLNAILGWANLLQRRGADMSTIEEGLSVIVRSARTQAKLIDDLLDLSRIMSGKIQLDVQSVDLVSLIDQAIETIRPAADAKEIRLERRLWPIDGTVRGDANRLLQVVSNLLSNAVKFTPRLGLVQISLFAVESDAQIQIADTGKGIKPEFLPHVFERFRQEDSSSTRQYGGLGLGLAIVKHITELHGGTVGVTSAGVDRGATFTVKLPIHARQQATADSYDGLGVLRNVDLHNARVLVVDDDESTCEMMRRILIEYNAQVEIAHSTSEAIERITSNTPDLLIGDIGMPGRDGYDLIRSVRASDDEEVARVPAVAVTAFARSQDRIAALEAGFNLHLAKPVEPRELIAAAAALMAPSRRAAALGEL